MGIKKEAMKSSNISRNTFLILICIFCIALIGWAFYIEEFTLNHTIEIKSPQESSPDIIYLDSFTIPTDHRGGSVTIIHDNNRNVTCYIFRRSAYGGGISCIPDSEIRSSKIENNYKKYIAR